MLLTRGAKARPSLVSYLPYAVAVLLLLNAFWFSWLRLCNRHAPSITVWPPHVLRADTVGAGADSVRTWTDVGPSSRRGCPDLPGSEHVQVVMKTGATESREKLPIHFETTLKCLPNYSVYSDYEETFGDHHVMDALSDVPDQYKSTASEFEIYNRMKLQGRESVSHDDLTEGRNGSGWKLDKWKFLPIAEKTFAQNPDAHWYIFMEADTYMIFSNLLPWLAAFNHSENWYFGAQTQIADVIFAHGGSGFVISNSAMKGLVQYREAHRAELDELTKNHYAGDCVLGQVLIETGADLTWSWPLFQSQGIWNYDPAKVMYGRRRHCWPALSFHHMSEMEIQALHNFEQGWIASGQKAMISHADVFHKIVAPNLVAERTSWSNPYPEGSDGGKSALYDANKDYNTTTERAAHASSKDCRLLCEEQSDCLQYFYEPERCFLSTRIGMGRPDPGASSQAGWMMDRIHASIQSFEPCEEG